MAYRSWRCLNGGKREVAVPLFGSEGLFAQLGAEVNEHYKARQLLRQRLRLVQAAWRECPNELTNQDELLVRPAEAIGTATTMLPGVARTPPVALLDEGPLSPREPKGGRRLWLTRAEEPVEKPPK
jgi:hypothetical protein